MMKSSRYTKFLSLILVMILVACGQNQDPASDPSLSPTITSFSSPTPIAEPFPAPEFTLDSLDGDATNLRDYQGQWVLLNFWATWCKPCVEEMPILQTISEARDDLVVMGINVRERKAIVQSFLQDNTITYPILMTPQSPEGDAVLVNYQALSLPQTLLINPNGEIVWRAFGPLELDSFNQTLDEFIKGETTQF